MRPRARWLRRLSFLRRQDGMSIVNVVVAFVILLLLVAMFTQVMRMGQNMIARADEIREQTAAQMERYYMNDDAMSVTTLAPAGTEFALTDGSSSFVLRSDVYGYDDSLFSFGVHSLPKAGG